MKKKLLVLFLIIGVIAISVIAMLLFANRDTSFNGTTLAKIQKTLKDDSPACLKSSKTASVPAGDQNGLETAVIRSIIDVPAGTSVDIRVASFSTTEATGSAKYDGSYGTYNYVVKKVSDVSLNDQIPSIWQVTSFVACKE